MRCDERAVAVHRADTIAVAVRAQPGVVTAGNDGAAQCFHVRLDGLRIHAAKTRIAIPPNLIAIISDGGLLARLKKG